MAKKELKFEEALERLEDILRRLESGEGSLDALLKDYEEGVALLRTCNERLAQAEQRVRMLQFTPDGVTAVDFNTPQESDT
jgi:exodeoxyribonuclease VII small subunit